MVFAARPRPAPGGRAGEGRATGASMSRNDSDPETTSGGDDREAARAAAAPAEDPAAAGRRAALAELARLAALAPAMAVLFDPERARADLSGD
jgi:hypothetical protein